jgi:hypothetical protein
MRPWLVMLALTACGKTTPSPAPTETADTGPATDTEPTDTEPTDTEPPGTDEDGDGFTVEDGDCDDTSVWVNPGWPEDPTNDIDDDCDGRVDEVFTGLAVFEIDSALPAAYVHTIDALGQLKNTVTLSEPIVPYFLKDDFEGGGWVANDYLGIWRIAPDGAVTQVLDFEEVKLPKGVGEFGIYGVAAHPDGFYLVSLVNALMRVEVNGSWSIVAEWPIDLYGKKTHDVAPIDLAANRLTGEVGMMGVFGGMATWTPDGGYQLEAAGAPPYGLPYIINVETDDSGEFYGLGFSAKAQGVYKWSDAQGLLVEKTTWPAPDFTPAEMAVEGESGDWYVTANGGWFRTVWRLYADGTPGSQLFTTDADNQNASFSGIATLWEEDD